MRFFTLHQTHHYPHAPSTHRTFHLLPYPPSTHLPITYPTYSPVTTYSKKFFQTHLHPLTKYNLPNHTITLQPTTPYRECDKRTRLSAQFLILIIKVCKQPNQNPLRNFSTGIPCSQPNNYHHHGLFRRPHVLLATAVPHHCPIRPHRTFTTPSFSSIIQNFTVFLVATFAFYVFILYPPPSPPGDLLDSIDFSFVLSDISDVLHPLSIIHIHSHSQVILPPSRPPLPCLYFTSIPIRYHQVTCLIRSPFTRSI